MTNFTPYPTKEMADISKCTNESCPLHNQCYRYTAQDSERQTYMTQTPIVTEDGVECKYFINNQ